MTGRRREATEIETENPIYLCPKSLSAPEPGDLSGRSTIPSRGREGGIMFFLVFLVSVLISGFAAAANAVEVETLPPLVTISTRVDTPEANVANSVTVIDDKKIEARRAESVLEMLRDVPGVDVVQNGSPRHTPGAFLSRTAADQGSVF